MSNNPNGAPNTTYRAAKDFARNIIGDDIPNVFITNSLPLTTSNSIFTINSNFTPELWIVVATLTAGEIRVHRGNSREATYVRLVSRLAKLPYHLDSITIECVGATGTFDVYAVARLGEFDINS